MIEIHTISPPLILLASGHNDADANELYQVLVDHIRGRGGREEGCTGKGDERIVQGGGGRGKGEGGMEEGGREVEESASFPSCMQEHGNMGFKVPNPILLPCKDSKTMVTPSTTLRRSPEEFCLFPQVPQMKK